MSTPTLTPEITIDNLYDMSDEDFAKLQSQHQALVSGQDGDAVRVEPAAQPRDPETGRFTSKQESEPAVDNSEETQTETQTVDEILYRRVIDLGDGSGVQVFEAPSQEELIEKLATAQENATRKIRELAAATRAKEQQTEHTAPSEDELWVLGQQMLTDPIAAFDRIFEKRFGRKPDDVKKVLEKAENRAVVDSEETAAKEWLATHPGLTLTEAEGNRIERYIRTWKLDATVENIEKAFQELSEIGLIKGKTETNTSTTAEQNPNSAGNSRIAKPTVKTVVVQRKASGGLSPRTAAAAKPELTEEDLYNMSDEEFAKLDPRGMSQSGW